MKLFRTQMKALVPFSMLALVLANDVRAQSTNTGCFTYTNFYTTNGLALTGVCATTGGVLRLTPAAYGQQGNAWRTDKQYCGGNFDVRFQFQMTAQGSQPNTPSGGDGIGFAIQNSGPVDTDFIGLTSGSNYTAVYFNTFWNWPGCTDPQNCDVSANSVGVLTNGVYAVQADLDTIGINLKDGAVHSVRIFYSGTNLVVWLDNVSVLTNVPAGSLTGTDDSGQAWVGFGAGTGWAWENHDILNWSFCSWSVPTTFPPSIITQPASQTVNVGDTASFSVTASGTQPLTYQWTFNGTNISGATTSSLVLNHVQLSQAGSYAVQLTNAYGSTISSAATLTVNQGSGSCVPPPSGLISWWQGEGNASDQLGLNNGTLINGTGFGAGEVNHAFLFNGSNQVVQASNSPSLNPTSGLTIEAWVYPTMLPDPSGSMWVAAKDAVYGGITPRQYQLALVTLGTNLFCRAHLGVPSGFTYFNGTNALPLNAWSHVAMTYDGSALRLFVNGLPDATQAVTGSITTGSSLFWIGGAYPGAWFFKGLIDEVSLYNRALSGGELAAIYGAGSAGKCAAPAPPSIYSQPASQAVPVGGTATFSVGASGTAPLSYQWMFNGTNVDSATNSSLTLSNVQQNQAGNYSVAVSNSIGGVVSSNAVLTVNALPPSIVHQPASQSVRIGATAAFSVQASGSAPLSYQWLFNGSNIAGANATSLTLTNVQTSQAGNYSIIVSNAFGAVMSSNATLTVTLPPATVRTVGSTNPGGGTFVVPVLLVANGNENALSFSLTFATNRLNYGSVALGSNASSANLLVNTNQIGSGRLGVALALAPDATFPAGTQEVVDVTFTGAIVTNNTTVILTFGDTPTLRQLSDPPGNALPAIYTNGLITLTPTDFEGDVSPRPTGDRRLSITDWVLVGRFAARLDYPTNGSEFQRADCAPRSGLGDGQITVADWVQAGRYAVGLDPMTPVGGPTSEVTVASAPFTPPLVTHPPSGGSAHPDDLSRTLTVGNAMLQQGQAGTVLVTLNSQGNENAFGFSLSFDPTMLAFVSASLGSADSGAALNVNTNQAAAGKLGIALALSTGNSFVTGLDQVLKLNFQAAPSASGTTHVSFMDQPVPRDVADPTANDLTTMYFNGTITVTGPPTLSISQSKQAITLSWPGWATNFILQEAIDFKAGWTNTTATPVNTNNQNILVLPAAADNKFYRLYHP